MISVIIYGCMILCFLYAFVNKWGNQLFRFNFAIISSLNQKLIDIPRQ